MGSFRGTDDLKANRKTGNFCDLLVPDDNYKENEAVDDFDIDFRQDLANQLLSSKTCEIST